MPRVGYGLLLAACGAVRATRSKAEVCAEDYERSNRVLDLIHVSSDHPIDEPRILCFVNTISTNHATKARAIKDTWGQRCTRLVFLSNATDYDLDAVALDVTADHDHLWQKHKASMQYIWETYRHDFDWFYKADDDAYVIMENLRAFLRSPEIVMQQDIVPLQMGHRFRLTNETIHYYVGDKSLLKEYTNRWPNWWVFNSGGPGVVMNSLYMRLAVESFPKRTCLSDKYSVTLPDDASIAFCMAWNGVFPPNTRDLQGRERWHANHPHGVYYTNPANFPRDVWFNQYHRDIGGIQWKEDCCAPDSIAFHYISPEYMRHMERQLYFCRH